MGEACISSLIPSSSSTRVINIIIATDRKYDKCNTGGQVQLFAVASHQRNSHFFNGGDVDDVADDDGGEKHKK